MKTCRRCHGAKAASEFRADARNRDGLGSWCIACHRERGSEWSKENRDRLNEKQAARRLANPDAARAVSQRYKQNNKGKCAAAHAKWAKLNPDKRRASTAKRKAAKLRATPTWADAKAIAAIYSEAARKPGRWHVDHIVPLQGETVSGLHCEANLQVLSGAENEGKRNRWWPDMFEDAQRQQDLFIGNAA